MVGKSQNLRGAVNGAPQTLLKAFVHAFYILFSGKVLQQARKSMDSRHAVRLVR